MQNPVILIPGITGVTLSDHYPLDPRMLWSPPFHREYARITLHPDDTRYENLEPALVRPERAVGIVYDGLLRSLRHDLSKRADQPTPVFPFVYDWRQPLAATAVSLWELIEEVIDRTKLLRHYAREGQRLQVDLVAHSMGALVVCEHLSRAGKNSRVGKVATLGAPFRGTLEALAQIVAGAGGLSEQPPAESERELARITPSLYHMLPSYEGSVVADGKPIDHDFFRIETWQEGVGESLAEFVRLHSVQPGRGKVDHRRKATALLTRFLDEARAHRQRVDRLDLRAVGMKPEDWLVVVGIGGRTRLDTEPRRVRGRLRYDLGDRRFRSAWPDEDPDSRETGDETVPLTSALPSFLGPERVVAVTKDDFGFWELRDRLGAEIVSLHAFLPRMNLVERLCLRHLRKDYRGQVWGRPVPGVSPEAWNPPIPGLSTP